MSGDVIRFIWDYGVSIPLSRRKSFPFARSRMATQTTGAQRGPVNALSASAKEQFQPVGRCPLAASRVGRGPDANVVSEVY